MALVLTALGLQVVYADSARRCLGDDALALCQGPLYAWVTPVTLLAGGILVIVGLWLILANHRASRWS
jgi:hypothetical protein